MTEPRRDPAAGPGAAAGTPSRWAEIRAVAEAALAMPPQARAGFLNRACRGDAPLREEVEAQVEACERAVRSTDFLAEPAATFAAPLLAPPGRGDFADVPGEAVAAGDAVKLKPQAALNDRYALEGEVGRGGTATVYLARDLLHDRRVAIKVLNPSLGAALSAERFLREIRVTAGLTHPHILPLHDSGESDGFLYYVMPFVEGETLRERLAREGSLPIADALRLLREMVSALAYAHRQGIVHRDVKPANILLADGHAVVADFGIARAVHRAREQTPPDAAPSAPDPADRGADTLTAAGTSPGTPAYMAPEQARGGADVDHRADLYALGVVAYEALAGVHPFRARAPGALIAAHLGETPAPLGAIRPDVPPALAALVRQLLAKDPAARPRNAEEVLRSLDTVPASLSDAPEQIAREPELPVRMRNAKRIRWRTLAVALLLVLLALVGYSLRSRTAAARSGTGPEPGPAEIQTLAVLPFENLGGSAADEYFSDGMADELAHALSRLPDLKIAGRTSSYAFTKMEVPTQQIGRTLGVAALVTGTVRRSGERLRVTTQLVSTADGTLLWDSIFESHTGDVFAVQDELTRAIVTALAPALRADAVASKGRGTTDPEAYELYLKGHYHFLLRGAENLERAIGYFERAIARDPGFARAHAGLALVYNVVPIYVPVASDSIVARMESSARRALVLDSTLADAHLAMASVLELQLRFREALPHYRAAVALDPASATAHHWYGMNLLMQGQHDDALAELHRATQLDPLAPSAAGGVSLAYLFARRLPEALDAGRHALSLHSTNPVVILAMGRVQVFAGEPDSAARTLERGLQLYPRDARLMAELVFAYAAAGRWDEAARIRARLHRRDVALLDGTEPAFADLVFGDLEPLVRVLSSAEGARRYVMGGGILGCDPLLDPLWADARFRAAMRRIGIEPCTLARRWSLPPPQRTEGR